MQPNFSLCSAGVGADYMPTESIISYRSYRSYRRGENVGNGSFECGYTKRAFSMCYYSVEKSFCLRGGQEHCDLGLCHLNVHTIGQEGETTLSSNTKL